MDLLAFPSGRHSHFQALYTHRSTNTHMLMKQTSTGKKKKRFAIADAEAADAEGVEHMRGVLLDL